MTIVNNYSDVVVACDHQMPAKDYRDPFLKIYCLLIPADLQILQNKELFSISTSLFNAPFKFY